MKKLNVVFLLSVLSIFLFAGCSQNQMSTMVRTVGVGESAMPINAGSFAIESFMENATTVDNISSIDYHDLVDFASEDLLMKSKIKDNCRYIGLNGRVGFDNYTELKLGFFIGMINYSNNIFLHVDGNNQVSYEESIIENTFAGFQLGVKRLLTDYENPFRMSLYLEGKQIFIEDSGSSVAKYDGTNTEFKSALIFGYLDDPAIRNFPSLSLYYSLANTSRKETIPGISAKRHPQAIGLETNFNLDLGAIYANVATGLEKEIVDKTKDKIIPYASVSVGFQFMRKK